MSSLSKPRTSTNSTELDDCLRERVVSDITPFFLNDVSDDPISARETARQMLVCYNAATERELQLSAQIVAFSMASLECLGCSMAERDLSVDVLLRIQGHAIKLNDLAEKSRKALEARQRDRQKGQASTQQAVELDEAEFQAAVDKARQMVAFARAKLQAHRASKAVALAKLVKLPGQPAHQAPVMSTPIAEHITPDTLARRKQAERLWAKELGQLTQLDSQTRH